ncbi:hypothetical protein AB4Y44_10455 [Paraburkholderia sp. BR10937]|uniref:hypothetical protein n=1 Tax=Paraburkholderia sp. BR10937 TaxID=3236994 RepID=UPI0034D373EE
MSKRLANLGARAFIADLYRGRENGLRLRPPGSFEFFNSLRYVDADSFAGVTVVLIESVYWSTDNGRVSSLVGGDGNPVYSGSIAVGQPLPGAVSGEVVERWIAVISRELDLRPGDYRRHLDELGCERIAGDEDDTRDSLFMFLRALNILSFDERRRDEAMQMVAAQPEAPGYIDTAVEEFLPFYEQFELYRLRGDAALAGRKRSIFWFSFVVAAFWSDSRPSYLTVPTLEQMLALYGEAHWHFPIDNARTAVVASHFKHCYIELYRCLEWLYALPRAIAVKRELGLATKATALARTFRSELGWRRKELDSLTLLLRDARVHSYPLVELNRCMGAALPPKPVRQQDDTDDIFAKRKSDWSLKICENVADRLYKVRNQFVHQLEQVDIQPVSKEAEAWLISLLAWLCVELYRRYAPEFDLD